jgi:hypothetical protein
VLEEALVAEVTLRLPLEELVEQVAVVLVGAGGNMVLVQLLTQVVAAVEVEE